MGPVITKHKPTVPKKIEVVKRSPFNVEVTGGWYVNARHQNPPTWFWIVLFSCFFGAGFAVAKLNSAILRDNQDVSLRFEIRALGVKVKNLEESIKILQSRDCAPDTSSQLPVDSDRLVFRKKRSNIEAVVEQREKRKNRQQNRTKIRNYWGNQRFCFKVTIKFEDWKKANEDRRPQYMVAVSVGSAAQWQNYFSYSEIVMKTMAVQFSAFDPFGLAKSPVEGVLGPWMESSSKDTRNMDLLGVALKEEGRQLEISRKGLYFVYAQVTYRTINVSDSFSINVISSCNKRNVFVSTCSAYGNITRDGEQSCYTAAVYRFDSGDLVYLQQGQPNRNINFEDSFTFFGLIFLG